MTLGLNRAGRQTNVGSIADVQPAQIAPNIQRASTLCPQWRNRRSADWYSLTGLYYDI
jgi:hypothetical protein